MDCVLDIVRDSSGLLCSSLPLFLFITLVLIFPVSSITLSQVMTNSHLAGQLSAHLGRHLAQVGLRLTPFTSLFYMQLSQTLVSQAMCFPVILTLWMLAKTAIFYISGCRERGKQVSVMGFLEEAPRAWSRIAATYVWGCLLVVLVTGMVLFLEITGAILLRSIAANVITIEGFETLLCWILDVVTMVAYAIVLAPLVIILNLGSVVAGMEERRRGGWALLQALSLLKRRNLKPALLLFLVTGIAMAGIECAFQYRVLGRASEASSGSGPSFSLLEAPFLIFAHSFLLLFDTLMSFVFYHACQSGTDTSSYTRNMVKQEEEEEEEVEDHFSIAVQIVEEQCRKIMYTSTTMSML